MIKSIIITSFLILFALSSCGQKPNLKPSNIKKDKIMKTEEQWKKQLSSNQYYILREKGTERPGSSEFLFHKEKGIYKCGGCGNELFSDEMKFESHCGWPSFDREIAGGKIIQVEDHSHGMERIEIQCARCGGHLGHIFNDGPTETGVRYCVNGGALSFEPMEKKNGAVTNDLDTLTFGGGCFWCMEAVFQDLKGVASVLSGYSGGNPNMTDYEQVSSGLTNHAEVVQIAYNSKQISLTELLKVFFSLHDPTTLNRQGADVGTQYRSVIFYRTEKQKEIAHNTIQKITEAKIYDDPIVTELTKFSQFYKAEDYHQNYYKENMNKPYCRAVIQPKVQKLEKLFNNLLNK